MKKIDELAWFAIAVYSEYIKRGYGELEAQEKALKEVREVSQGIKLVRVDGPLAESDPAVGNEEGTIDCTLIPTKQKEDLKCLQNKSA
jgi:hypothetical protein